MYFNAPAHALVARPDMMQTDTQHPNTAPTAVRHDPYSALRLSSYRLFLSGRVVFMLGSQMQSAAVAWQIYERLGSKMALAWVGLVQMIPILLLTLPAGNLADRLNRKKIILSAQTLFFTCSCGLTAVSLFHGAPTLIYALLFLLAVGRSFAMPSMGALLPTVIPRTAWGNATTWNSSVFELMQMVGPALAGGLIAASGGATVLKPGTNFANSILLFSRLHPPRQIPRGSAMNLHDFIGGLRFMFKTKLLLAACSLDLFAMLLGGATALLPVVAKDILHVGPQGFGWLRAAPSIGAVVMALSTAHLPPWKRAGRVLFLSFFGFGAAIIVFGLSRNFWLSMAMLILTGVFDNLNVVIRQTLVQFITPDEMRGRVTAVNFLFIGASNELGAFESGMAAQFFGTALAISGGGLGAILVALAVMYTAPQLRRLRKIHDITPASV